MVQKDDELDVLMHVQSHVKTITHRESGATLKVLAADQNTVGGKKSVGTLVDELHLFGKISGAENMFREALGGRASRPEGFVIWLSTQSDEPPAGVFKQKLDYARKVRDGEIIDPGFVPIIFEHPPEMVANKDCLKLENMAMVNPNLGFSVDNQFLEREYRIASDAGGDSFRGFMAKHANVEIGLNLRSDRWAGADYWEQNGRPEIVGSLEELIDRCEVVTMGIDGGGLDDLLGVAVTGRETGSHRWMAWAQAWAHPSVLERRKSEASRFHDFARDGHLILVKQIGDDVQDVADIAEQLNASGKMDRIGVDPHGLGGIIEALQGVGIEEHQIIGISQGWKLTGAIKTTERKLAEGALIHGGMPLMAWCVGNARIVPVGNAVTINKQASGFAKIDPLMALFNAVSLLALNPQAAGKSFWETTA
jgi:phage terminase large subunit-like protein